MTRMLARTRWTLVAVAAVAAAATGCSTSIALTDKGQGVSRVTDAEKPGGCRLIGDVSIGVPPDAARPPTEDDLVTLMRNKAGTMGGTHVVVDSRDQRNPESETGSYWVGHGRAYACPQEEAATPAEEGTGLPEEPQEGAEELEEGQEGQALEDDEELEEESFEEEPEEEPARQRRRSPSGVSDDDLLDAI